MLLKFPQSISSNRLGTHRTESIIGMTRAILTAYIRQEKFVSSTPKASITASLLAFLSDGSEIPPG
jgi:hypothetical protein